MDPGTPGPAEGSSLRLVELGAEARYARERYQLYRARAYGHRARAYGPRLTNPEHLRELERRSLLAERLLERARAGEGRAAGG
jgi:hypothetical protein